VSVIVHIYKVVTLHKRLVVHHTLLSVMIFGSLS